MGAPRELFTSLGRRAIACAVVQQVNVQTDAIFLLSKRHRARRRTPLPTRRTKPVCATTAIELRRAWSRLPPALELVASWSRARGRPPTLRKPRALRLRYQAAYVSSKHSAPLTLLTLNLSAQRRHSKNQHARSAGDRRCRRSLEPATMGLSEIDDSPVGALRSRRTARSPRRRR